MGPRWVEKEMMALEEVKRRLRNEIAARPQYPDVVGDRRIIRFLRGKQNNVEETVKMFSGFLKWRDENNVDNIRNQILFGGIDTPFKFPNGKKIIDLAPQIIISAKAKDYKGQPLVLEQYCFSPSDMFTRVTIQDYLLFLVYALEYRALVMEQMSHEEEMKYIEKYPNPDDREAGYGVVLLNFCIRDLNGVGLAHLTGKGKQIIEAAIKIGLPNYPEYLGKCHMVNVPWLFTSMWFFIKGLLDDFILAKINLTGSKFIDVLLQDVPIESIPKALGGKFELYNESYAFDVSESGPFHLAGDAAARHPHIEDPIGSNGDVIRNEESADVASHLDTGEGDVRKDSERVARPFELQTIASTTSFVSTDSENSNQSHQSSDDHTGRLVTSNSTTSLTSRLSASALNKLNETQGNARKNNNNNTINSAQDISTKKSITSEMSSHSNYVVLPSPELTPAKSSTHSSNYTGPTLTLHSINSTTLPVCPKSIAPHHHKTTHITPSSLKQRAASAKQPSQAPTSSLSDLQEDDEVRKPEKGDNYRRGDSMPNTASMPRTDVSRIASSQRSAASSAVSAGAGTFRAMQHHTSSFSDADFTSSAKTAVDKSPLTVISPNMGIIDYVTSPMYIAGALVVLLISVADPTFAFRYLLVPFLFTLFFVYVI